MNDLSTAMLGCVIFLKTFAGGETFWAKKMDRLAARAIGFAAMERETLPGSACGYVAW